jgi:hypothetical protein
MSSQGNTICETPDAWFAYIRATPWKNRSELSWVQSFANVAPQTSTFWASLDFHGPPLR